MDEIKWQQPPAAHSNTVTQWAQVAEQLRARPGEWANVGAFISASTSWNVRAGVYQGFAPGEFEATTRKRPDGKYDIYVRYVGEVRQADLVATCDVRGTCGGLPCGCTEQAAQERRAKAGESR